MSADATSDFVDRAVTDVVVIAFLPRASTAEDDREAAAVGVDAVVDGAVEFGPPRHVTRVAAPVSPHDIGIVCASLHAGARVVVCDCTRPAEARGLVRAVRTYEILLSEAQASQLGTLRK